MFPSRRFIKDIIFVIPILILILICLSPVPTSAEISSADYEEPVFKILIPEKAQQEIWLACEENNLAYTFVLAILQMDGDNDAHLNDPDGINKVIEQLVYYRDYWREQGYCDEMVFDLIILSRQRGIDSCKAFIQNNGSSEHDLYVQKVTAYKYFLDQIEYNVTNGLI